MTAFGIRIDPYRRSSGNALPQILGVIGYSYPVKVISRDGTCGAAVKALVARDVQPVQVSVQITGVDIVHITVAVGVVDGRLCHAVLVRPGIYRKRRGE